MTHETWDEDEPLIEGLARPFAGGVAEPSASFSAEVLRKTTRVVRWRVRRRWLAVACGVLVAYLAGLGTTRMGGGGVPEGDGTARVAPAAEPVPAAPVRSGDALLAALPAGSKALRRHIAAVPRAERPRVLREAGDRYLAERTDIGSAMTCYRALLDNQDPARRVQPEPDDSWLLLYLKTARQKEATHGKANF